MVGPSNGRSLPQVSEFGANSQDYMMQQLTSRHRLLASPDRIKMKLSSIRMSWPGFPESPGRARAWGREEDNRAMQLSDHAFRKLVDEALAQVPAEFRPFLDGLPVFIEDWAPDDLLDALGIPEDETLYGIYRGHPITEGPPGSGELPPRITIYRAPLLEDCADEDGLRLEITTTVLHEIAHHFGIGEARLKELGWD
jgi:predicted Zn-dependent protease with MMP-like domain